jgi:hypothetical protein
MCVVFLCFSLFGEFFTSKFLQGIQITAVYPQMRKM